MVVEKGFKHTNFGEVPIEWEVRKLGKIAVIKDGTHQTPKYFESGIPFYSVENVTSNDFNNTKFISELEHNFLTRHFRIEKGDVLMTRIGSIGDCKYVDWNPNASFYVSLALLKFDNPHIAKYFYHFSQSNIFKKEIELNSLQHAVPKKINLGNISIVRILLPNTEIEQTAIANALSDMDALISQTEKLIEKKKGIKQGVMQELLKPKEGWVTKKLGEIGEISGAGVDKKIVDGEVPVRLVNYMDVYKRDFIYSNELSHWVTAPNQKLLSCQVRKGDVFFTPSSETREDIALPAVAMEDIDDAVYSYHLVRFRAFDNWDLRFKAYIFNTIQFLQQAEKQCEGSGKRYVLTLPKFRSLLISYPSSVEEQEKISDIIWDIDIEIQTTETKLQKLKHQKHGMMQALLTGKIRLI